MRSNFSLVARYSLKFIRYSLLVAKSLVAPCKTCSLLVTEVALYKKSLVTCCKKPVVTRWRSSSLQKKITCYWLQNSLLTRCRSCSLQKITRYLLQKLLVTKIHSLLVATFARYSLQRLLIDKNHLLLFAKFARYSLQKLPFPKNLWFFVTKFPRYSLQKIILF